MTSFNVLLKSFNDDFLLWNMTCLKSICLKSQNGVEYIIVNSSYIYQFSLNKVLWNEETDIKQILTNMAKGKLGAKYNNLFTLKLRPILIDLNETEYN